MTVTRVRCLTGVGSWRKICRDLGCETIPNDAIKRMLLDCIRDCIVET